MAYCRLSAVQGYRLTGQIYFPTFLLFTLLRKLNKDYKGRQRITSCLLSVPLNMILVDFKVVFTVNLRLQDKK
ncbi:hypothetical protein L1987_00178 [Smallanthus sonchifolius]|uniref:Uncharacterized protein n=1 Tax=Smallanthus sonchifolius TaxID=185202 RepID=A0ACB9K1P4_9ASTR|nr:hypothetical protein L1987_00178 [Smallanthus sonchifolius]